MASGVFGMLKVTFSRDAVHVLGVLLTGKKPRPNKATRFPLPGEKVRPCQNVLKERNHPARSWAVLLSLSTMALRFLLALLFLAVVTVESAPVSGNVVDEILNKLADRADAKRITKYLKMSADDLKKALATGN